MLHFFKRKKNNTSERTVDLLIDAPVYQKLKKRAHMEGISENEVLLYSLKRGMSDYWLHVMKDHKDDYELVKGFLEQCKRDNELLEAIINQNVRFHEILDEK